MLTIILTAILFGFGGGFLACSGYIPPPEYANNNFLFIFIPASMGCYLGLLIGLVLSEYLSRFVTYKYPYPINKDSTFHLLPFSDGKTYLVNNDGDINYRAKGDVQDVQTANREEIAYIKVSNEEDFPYVAYSYLKKSSFWGLFVTSFPSSNSKKPLWIIFVVPKETMIKKGRVDIITATNYRLVLD